MSIVGDAAEDEMFRLPSKFIYLLFTLIDTKPQSPKPLVPILWGFLRRQFVVGIRYLPIFIPIFNPLSWACAYAKLLQSCLTLCDAMDCSSPGSTVHGISQARILEWVAIPFSRGSSLHRDRTPVSCGSYIADRLFTAEPPGKPWVWIQPNNSLLMSRKLQKWWNLTLKVRLPIDCGFQLAHSVLLSFSPFLRFWGTPVMLLVALWRDPYGKEIVSLSEPGSGSSEACHQPRKWAWKQILL